MASFAEFINATLKGLPTDTVSETRSKVRTELNKNRNQKRTKHRIMTDSPLAQENKEESVPKNKVLHIKGLERLEQLKKWKEERAKKRLVEKANQKKPFISSVHSEKLYNSVANEKYNFAASNHKFKAPSNIKPIQINKKNDMEEAKKSAVRKLNVATSTATDKKGQKKVSLRKSSSVDSVNKLVSNKLITQRSKVDSKSDNSKIVNTNKTTQSIEVVKKKLNLRVASSGENKKKQISVPKRCASVDRINTRKEKIVNNLQVKKIGVDVKNKIINNVQKQGSIKKETQDIDKSQGNLLKRTKEQNSNTKKTKISTKNLNTKENKINLKRKEEEKDNAMEFTNNITKTPKVRQLHKMKALNLNQEENFEQETKQSIKKTPKKSSILRKQENTTPEEDFKHITTNTPKSNIKKTPRIIKQKKMFEEPIQNENIKLSTTPKEMKKVLSASNGITPKGNKSNLKTRKQKKIVDEPIQNVDLLFRNMKNEINSSTENLNLSKINRTPKTRKRVKSVAFSMDETVISSPRFKSTTNEANLDNMSENINTKSYTPTTPKGKRRKTNSVGTPSFSRGKSPGKTPRRRKTVALSTDTEISPIEKDLYKELKDNVQFNSSNEYNSIDYDKSASEIFNSLQTSNLSQKSQFSDTNEKDIETPESKKPEPVYLSPFVTTSRGKQNAREENTRKSHGADTTSAQYFYKLLADEIKRIQGLCDQWETYKNSRSLPEEACNMINVPIGQSNLLISKKMTQFRQLIDKYSMDNDSEEFKVTISDLQGYWDTVMIQVENLNHRFENLERLKSNNWEEVIPHKKPQIKSVTKKRILPPRSAKIASKIREAIVEARKRHLSVPQSKEFNGGFFNIKSPIKGSDEAKSAKKQRNSLLRTAVENRRSALASGLAVISATVNARRSEAHSPFLKATPRKSILKVATPISTSKKSVIFQLPDANILYQDEDNDKDLGVSLL